MGWGSLGMGLVYMGVPGDGVGAYGGPKGWVWGSWVWGKCIWGSLGMGWGSLGMGWVHLGVPRDGVGLPGYGVSAYGGP